MSKSLLALGLLLPWAATLPAAAQTRSGRCQAQASDQITCSVAIGTGGPITFTPRLISRGPLSSVTGVAELVLQTSSSMTALGSAATISAASSTNVIGGPLTVRRGRNPGLVELTIRGCRNGTAVASCQVAFPPALATFQLLSGN